MSIPNRQVGWSTGENLLWQISKQLEYLTRVTNNIQPPYYNGDFLPSVDNVYSLGSTTLRWKSIHLGEGTLYITDTVTGAEAAITVTNGVLYINGINQLQVGELRFIANTIESTETTTDIQIGLLTSLANLVLNRNVVLGTGKTLTFADSTIQNTAYIPAVSQTFDPAFTDLGGALAGVTSTGHYTMVSPKICFFRVKVLFDNCTNFGTTQYQFNLPFPSVETLRIGNATIHRRSDNVYFHIAGIADSTASLSIMKLYYSGSTTDLAWKSTTPVGATTTSSHFDISGIYQIA